MNEGKKTGIFWIAAALMLGIGALMSWQPTTSQQSGQTPINTALFEKFKDPLAAASMKVVTFDEDQGALETFEVRKDRQSGAWTIPSRDGYPADAVEQMKDAANSLVDLKILETILAEPKNHKDFGVVEPNLEDLAPGDEGVGRLVTFKDADQKTLASLIIGDPVKDQEGQLYVRRPNEDPVYVVSLDDNPLTTKFQDWIEDDLLKLSSIDVETMQVKDYSANVNPLTRQISLVRNFDVDLSLDGSTWKLDDLREYDPKNPLAPKRVDVGEDQELNTTKLNEIKNALDDVKIAGVVRKPEGMSANLKADKELAADDKAVSSLLQRGFYPARLSADGETEILSANGELVVGLNDGVEYVLRFGNISGLSDEEDSDEAETADGEEKKSSAGVNRYLLVTARVNEEKFPPPDLKAIPQSIEEVEGFGKSEQEPAETSPPADQPKEPESADPEASKTKAEGDPAEEDVDESAKQEPAAEQKTAGKADDKATESADQESSDTSSEDAAEDKAADADTSGETEASGSGEGGGSGQGQDPADDGDVANQDAAADQAQQAKDTAKQENAAEPKAETDEPKAETDEPKADADEPKAEPDEPKAETETPAKTTDQAGQTKLGTSAEKDPAPEGKEDEEMSDEEKQELLESEQEKITKENQRKLDERKDKIEAAKKRVRELTARFADWYYVIPEDTYAKLRVRRDELFKDKAAEEAAAPPALNFPQTPQ